MEAHLFLVLLVVAVLESVLSFTWRPIYFRVGIPIFTRTQRAQGSGVPPQAAALEERMPERPYSAFAFRDLGDDTFAFRERGLELGKVTYSAIMRGVVRFNRTRSEVVVTGYLNWFALVFFGVITTWTISWAPANPLAPLMIVAAAGLAGWIYSIQRRRFKEVAEVSAKLWRGV